MRHIIWRRDLDQPGCWTEIDDFPTDIDALQAVSRAPKFETLPGDVLVEIDYVVLPQDTLPLGASPKKKRRRRR